MVFATNQRFLHTETETLWYFNIKSYSKVILFLILKEFELHFLENVSMTWSYQHKYAWAKEIPNIGFCWIHLIKKQKLDDKVWNHCKIKFSLLSLIYLAWGGTSYFKENENPIEKKKTLSYFDSNGLDIRWILYSSKIHLKRGTVYIYGRFFTCHDSVSG